MTANLGQKFTISCDGHFWHPVRPHRNTGLHSPPLPVPPSLTVTLKQLVLAIGRSVCSRTAPSNLVTAQVNASFAALAGCCDFSGGEIHIQDVIKHLNETKRNAIAHDVGAGVANLIMQDMGYAWMGLAEDHIDPKMSNGFKNASRPDLIFDAGGGTNEYIAVEAKGSTPTPNGWVSSNLDKRLRNASTRQIANVLGASTFDGSIISRGLAAGFLGVAGGPAGTYRVFEAEPPATPSLPLRGISAAVSFPDRHSPMPLIAMRHYYGVLRLIGGHYTADRLLQQIMRLTGRAEMGVIFGEDEPRIAEQRFFMKRGFVLGDAIDLTSLGWGTDAPKIRFAMYSDVLIYLQSYIMDVTSERARERVTLPTEGLAGVYFETSDSQRERIVDFDGLAIFTDQDLESEDSIEM